MLNALERNSLEAVQEIPIARILRALIQARSDVPPGDTRTAISIVESELKIAGIFGTRFAKDPVRVSLLAEIGEEGSRPILLFHSHIDTVPAGDHTRWTYPPFEGIQKEDVLYGRGAGDDKGSVAAQLAAFITLSRALTNLKGRIILAIVADEESGGLLGTRWLLDEGHLNVDTIVIGEQTNNSISVAERVACGIDLTIYGTSAHGAMPEKGENAIMKASRALNYLEERLLPQLSTRKHAYLPSPTLNIGKIDGGIQWNVVPDRCVIQMDRRLIPGETRERALAEIQTILDQYCRDIENLRYDLSSEGDIAANVETDPQNPFVQMAQGALENLVGEPRPLTGYSLTSDGRWLVKSGIPIIHFGPGNPALAHSTDEHIHVGQVMEAAKFYTLLGLRWQNSL